MRASERVRFSSVSLSWFLRRRIGNGFDSSRHPGWERAEGVMAERMRSVFRSYRSEKTQAPPETQALEKE